MINTEAAIYKPLANSIYTRFASYPLQHLSQKDLPLLSMQIFAGSEVGDSRRLLRVLLRVVTSSSDERAK
jgi:hypothetical protein